MMRDPGTTGRQGTAATYDLVRWGDVGTVPFDALGAPRWKPSPARAAAGQPRGHDGEARP